MMSFRTNQTAMLVYSCTIEPEIGSLIELKLGEMSIKDACASTYLETLHADTIHVINSRPFTMHGSISARRYN